MIELPQPLREPLHILPPWLPLFLLWLGAVALLAGLLLLAFKRRKRIPRMLPLPVPAAAVRKGTFKSQIEKIISDALSSRNYRGGIHRIAAAVRQTLSNRTGVGFEFMTVDEMKKVLNGRKLIETLTMLEDRQFSRHEPSAEDLRNAGDGVISVLSRGGRIGLKRKTR